MIPSRITTVAEMILSTPIPEQLLWTRIFIAAVD